MMKRRSLVIGVLLCLALGTVACGKKDGQVPVEPAATATVAPTEEPAVTATAVPTEEPAVTATAVPTEEPEATVPVAPTEDPEATATATPTEEPETTATAAPTEEPEPTVPVAPTEEPEATATVAPTEVPEPTATPVPTATPKPTSKPTPTPAPTSKPGAELTIRFFAPKILNSLDSIVAKDALDFINQMNEYLMPEKGMMTETAMLTDSIAEYFKTAETNIVQEGEVLENARVRYGEDVVVTANGWYDSEKMYDVEVQKDIFLNPVYERRIIYYSSRSEKNFEYFAVIEDEEWIPVIKKGDEIFVFANYWVEMNGKKTLYNPCILDVQLDLGIFKTTMTYLVAMPVKERIVLPKLDGYVMEWVEDENTMSSEKIRIIDGMINRYTLVVKPK